MLFIILLFLLVSSVALFFLKRDRQTLLMLGLCLSFACMFVGIIIYLAKTGGLSHSQKVFLYFDTRIQRRISYLVFPLRSLGYMIAIGRFLFPAFLLMVSCNYSMIPAILRWDRRAFAILALPAISLVVYYPEIFYELVRTRFGLQAALMRLSKGWIYLYLIGSAALLLHEYRMISIPYCKRQFRYILVFLLSLAVQYGIYCGQDPMQVYQMYSTEYMRYAGRLYANAAMGMPGWFLFSLFTLFFVAAGFWNLKSYTAVDYQQNREDLRIQRKIGTASMGVSVFVHSIKNQLLSNRVLLRKMERELAGDEPDLGRVREYSYMLADVNETMLGRMEELYKSIKSQSISLSPWSAGEVVDRSLELFGKKYPDARVRTEEVRTEGVRTEGVRTEGVRTEGARTKGARTKGVRTKEARTEGVRTEVGSTEGVRGETLLADKEYLSEVLYNLLTNAHEAVLSSGKADEDLRLIIHSERLYIMFEVKDNGPGISRQELDRIFDPFYTSKNTNHNWGMGLHYVRQIVRSHLGMLKVESEVGKGTSFLVLIPRYEPRGKSGEEAR